MWSCSFWTQAQKVVGYHRETHHFREEKSTKELTVPQHTRFILPLTSPDKIHRCAAWAVFFFYGHLSGRRPLHLANARPFGRSKAPLGLLLLRKRGILLSEETKNPNPSPIEKRFGFSLFGAMEGTRTPGLLIRSAHRAIPSIFGSYVLTSFLCDTSQVLNFEFLHPLSDFATICTLCTFWNRAKTVQKPCTYSQTN